MKKLLLIFLTTFSFAEFAIEPYSISYHYDRDKDYNEKHEYVAVAYFYKNVQFGLGTLVNSHYNRANFALIGIREEIVEYNNIKFGVFLDTGYITGYHYDIFVNGGIYTEYENFYSKLSISYKFVGFTIGYKFNGL